ncbi:MAG TPA: glycosyltransferase family 4 protein [Planctomycetota bacterium]|nr:glycosyltransferase family 4 protein [Planctomycetota bacterium]
MTLRILLASAYGPEARRGNASTCRRYAAAIRAAGGEAVWVHGEGDVLRRALDDALRGFAPDLVHGHHATRVGPALRAVGRPYVLSIGGTEFEQVEAGAASDAALRDAVAGARRLLVPGTLGAAAWVDGGYVDPSRLSLVPRAVAAPAEPPPSRRAGVAGPLRRAAGFSDADVVVLLPSGLRPGKDPLRAVRLFDRAAAEVPALALAVLGMPLDPTTVAAVRAAAATRPRVALLRPVPAEDMPAHYADADVVLNTSLHEGLSNALLEAQAAARPTLASAIPANRDAVGDDPAALFATDDDAVAKLVALAVDPALRERRGREGHAFVRRACAVESEARALLAAYAAAR